MIPRFPRELFPALAFVGVLLGGLLTAPWGTPAQPTRRGPDALPVTADGPALRALAARFQDRYEARRGAAYREILRLPVFQRIDADPGTELMGVGEDGRPIIYTIHNVDAAATSGTQHLHPGGISGYDVDGSTIGAGELAVWDQDAVRVAHQEFGGRAVKINPVTNGSHATHVAGTMVGSGVDPLARGMAPAAPLDSYDWDSDEAEMAAAALGGLQVSNHSYGSVLGWSKSSSTGIWTWNGDTAVNPVEDWLHGFYNQGAADWDQIMADAPEYLIVRSAGNDNGDAPNPLNQAHDHSEDGSTGNTDLHNPDCLGGYDCLGGASTSKNALVVGSVEDIPGGYTQASDVLIASYSSWGPTDDGRIKPDIVANGQGLYSADNPNDTAYASKSGTSMASPTAAGTVALLTELFEERFGKRPRGATLKAAVIHSAREAGSNPGPDYTHGWGLLDAVGAADLIMTGLTDGKGIAELTLQDGETRSFVFDRISNDIKVTLVWTDPAGTPVATSLDPVTPMLVNDLNLRLESPGVNYYPWVLNPASPGSAAGYGVNSRDNVEQVSRNTSNSGPFTVVIGHQGTLQGGSQDFTLIWEGLEPVDSPPTVLGKFPFAEGLTGLEINHAAPNADVGIVIEMLKPVDLERVTVPLLKVCDSPVTVNVYEWTGGETGTRGALVATGTAGGWKPGLQEYLIPVIAGLEACTQYNIAVETGPASTWGGLLEAGLSLPYAADGAFLVLEGESGGNPYALAFPRLGLHGTPTGGSVLDLDPGGFDDFVVNQSGERSLHLTAQATYNLNEVAWLATADGNQIVTATLYDYTGGVRGTVLAQVQALATDGSTLQDLPLSHLLMEGRRYEIAFAYDDMDFEVNNTLPIPTPFSAGPIRVDSFSTFLFHLRLRSHPQPGGDITLDLDPGPGEQTAVSAAPWSASVFAEALGDHILHSVGWYGDVQEGDRIRIRVFEASGTTQGTQLASVVVTSTGSGEQWHDVPLHVELSGGQQVQFVVALLDGGLDGAPVWPAAQLPAIVPNYRLYAAGSSQVPHLRIGTCYGSALGVEPEEPAPGRLQLAGASANPLRGAGVVRFSLAEPGAVRLDLIDIRGRRVRTLLDGVHPAGPGEVAIDTRDLASGVYFLSLRAGGEARTRKLTVVR